MMEIHRFLDPVLQRKSFERFKITAESAKKGISTTYNSTVDDFSFSKDLVLHLLAAQINHLIVEKRGTFLIGKRIFLIKNRRNRNPVVDQQSSDVVMAFIEYFDSWSGITVFSVGTKRT